MLLVISKQIKYEIIVTKITSKLLPNDLFLISYK